MYYSLVDIFPAEIISLIIDMVSLGDITWNADVPYQNTKACSTTCRAFLPHCRRHIFLCIEAKGWKLHKFISLLNNCPWIGDNIRILSIGVEISLNASMLFPLRHVTRLEQLEVMAMNSPKIVWAQLQPGVQSSFFHLMHLPTITDLGFHSIQDIIPSHLSHCKHLQSLTLNQTTFADDKNLVEGIKCRKLCLSGNEATMQKNIDMLLHLGKARKEKGMIFDPHELRVLSLEVAHSGIKRRFQKILSSMAYLSQWWHSRRL